MHECTTLRPNLRSLVALMYAPASIRGLPTACLCREAWKNFRWRIFVCESSLAGERWAGQHNRRRKDESNYYCSLQYFMPINVTCPGCLKRFTVSDKFAGKSGPCPSCQKTIKIPEKTDEVVIHAPDDAGPKDKAGRAILKPLRRKDVKLSLPAMIGAGLAAVVVFAIAVGLGLSGQQPPTALLVVGALLVAPPLVFVGYWFLRDDELEGYSGKQLLIRCGICAVAFAAIWALYAIVPKYVSDHASMAEYSGLEMAIFFVLMVALGTAVAVLSLELEVVQGVLQYVLYFGVTFLLAWLSGAHLAAPLSGKGSGSSIVPPPAAASPAESEAEKPDIPKLLQ